jgi:membrane-bound lytic murein transglycosylase D
MRRRQNMWLQGSVLGLCFGLLGLQVMGQSIATRHHLNAHAQLILHMDALESSWEVMNARAHEPNKGILTDTFSLPADEQLGRELRATLGEVKLELSPRIKDFILFFAKQRRSSMEALMGVASIYTPVISRHFAEMKMPLVLSMLPAALSAFHLRAISEDGNAGLWQLNHYVAVKQGLICNATVDERRDLYKSTRAAVGHLAELHQGYGDWTMSLVAYTCGPAGVNRARQRAGAKANFEQLYPFLPEGQRDYVPAFAAVAYVMTHAQKLGLRQLAMEAMPLPDRIQLQEPLKFTHVANALGIPEDQLRNMNPVCRTEVIPGIGMPVQLCLPNGYGQRFAALKDSIYTLQQKMEAEAKRNETKPIATSAETNEEAKPEYPKPVAPKPYAPPTGTVPITYTIRSGDNVGLIATWYGIPLKDLKAMNNLTSDRIKAGEKLTIWVAKADLARLGKIDGMTFEQKQATVGAKETIQPMPKAAPTNANYTLYIVKQGDNLWLISKKYPGVTPEAIMKANGVDTKLQPGMQLKIPKVAQ